MKSEKRSKYVELAAACYMMVGVLVHDGIPIPTKWLDVLSNAANNEAFDVDDLLPFEGDPIAGSHIDQSGLATNEGFPTAPLTATGGTL